MLKYKYKYIYTVYMLIKNFFRLIYSISFQYLEKINAEN
jgi:hypothetical protein